MGIMILMMISLSAAGQVANSAQEESQEEPQEAEVSSGIDSAKTSAAIVLAEASADTDQAVDGGPGGDNFCIPSNTEAILASDIGTGACQCAPKSTIDECAVGQYCWKIIRGRIAGRLFAEDTDLMKSRDRCADKPRNNCDDAIDTLTEVAVTEAGCVAQSDCKWNADRCVFKEECDYDPKPWGCEIVVEERNKEAYGNPWKGLCMENEVVWDPWELQNKGGACAKNLESGNIESEADRVCEKVPDSMLYEPNPAVPGEYLKDQRRKVWRLHENHAQEVSVDEQATSTDGKCLIRCEGDGEPGSTAICPVGMVCATEKCATCGTKYREGLRFYEKAKEDAVADDALALGQFPPYGQYMTTADHASPYGDDPPIDLGIKVCVYDYMDPGGWNPSQATAV